jgi:UDP-N-acetylmuramate dehydrogenase
MQIKKNYNLFKLNTFGINAIASLFVEVTSENEIKELFSLPEFKQNKKMFLGGGSNLLFTKDFDGIVVLNKLKGIEIIKAPTKVGVPTEVGKDDVFIRAMGGELWHDLVMFATSRNFGGIENLSLIPGTVGAAPMQNIGAYGATLNDTLLNVEAFEIENGKENKKKIFTKEECALGYRESVFKNELKGKYFISAVTLKLSKIPKKNVTYKILKDYLEENKIEVKSSRDISDAVASIRRSKLPDPKILGNAGSFFKNVFIEKDKLQELLEKSPDMPYFKETSPDLTPNPSPCEGEGGIIKIPAGWLIEQCGPEKGTSHRHGGASWKGYRIGNVGVHEKHSLVLVNYGGATGKEILELANKIIASVKEKFGLELIPEVNIV